MSTKQVILKSTGEVVHPYGPAHAPHMNPPRGYTDILIPRAGMNRGRKAVTERVRNGSLKTKKV